MISHATSVVGQKFHDTYAAEAPLPILWGLGRGSQLLVIDPVLIGDGRQQRLGGADADWRAAECRVTILQVSGQRD
jgi:hypothetical protein